MIKPEKNGFALMELLIVIFVVSLFSALSFAYYRNFAEKRKLDHEVKLVAEYLDLASKKSLSADLSPKPSCSNFLGYDVDFPNSTSYELRFNCQGDQPDPILTRTVQTGLAVSAAGTILFKPLSAGTNLSVTKDITVTNTSTGQYAVVEVDPSGTITQGEIYTPASTPTPTGGGPTATNTPTSSPTPPSATNTPTPGGSSPTLASTTSSFFPGDGTITIFDLPHTVASGLNRALFVGVSYRSASSRTVSSVTFNGDPLTKVETANNTNSMASDLWYRVAPDVGTYNVSVTFSVAPPSNPSPVGIGATSWTNVSQTTPIGTPSTNVGNSLAPAVNVSSASNQVVIDALGTNTYGSSGQQVTALIAGTGQTERYELVSGIVSGERVTAAGSTEVGSTSTTMSWSITATSNKLWAIVAVPIRPAN